MNTETNTIRSVLWMKFVRIVEETPFRSMVTFVSLSFLAGLLSSILTAPETTTHIFTTIMEWRRGTIPVVFWSFTLVFGARPSFRFLVDSFSGLSKTQGGDMIEGVPTAELIDHLFEHNSFKRQEIEAKFGVPRNRYHKLAERMESVGILIRGENNSRILNKDLSRAQVAEHLIGKVSADQIDSFRVVHSPTPERIFTTRPVSQTA